MVKLIYKTFFLYKVHKPDCGFVILHFLGGNEQSIEESSYVFEDGNEVEAAEQLEIID